MTETTTKTAAIKRARTEVQCYRHGSGYVVSYWDDAAKARRVDHLIHYRAASDRRTECVAYRALWILGLDAEDASEALSVGPYRVTGSVRERVYRVLAATTNRRGGAG